MSESNQSANSTSGIWDYLQQPAETPAVENKPEEKKVEGGAPAENSEGNPEQEHKPWQSQKNETPVWARKRFKEYSTTVRELKDQNSQLMETVKQVLGQIKPNGSKLKEEDFPDRETYINHLADQRTSEKLTQYDSQRKQEDAQREEFRTLQEADARNVAAASADLPDYHEAIQHGDSDIRLPIAVAKHLSMSPAGPYVKYRIATDDSLAEALKTATPEQKVKLISDLHDSVLDVLIERSKKTGAAPAQQGQRAPSAPGNKKAPPKAPPVVKGKGKTDLLSLSGDEYVRARNEARNKR